MEFIVIGILKLEIVQNMYNTNITFWLVKYVNFFFFNKKSFSVLGILMLVGKQIKFF